VTGRMTILGTEGYIEIRKYIDIAGRAGANHLFLVNQKRFAIWTVASSLCLMRATRHRHIGAYRDRHVAKALLSGNRIGLKAQKQAQRLNFKL